ncbi:uncharacterized protein K02A2.6-like [Rhipicephalus sanguineus]|uniref:uncharacterized protein K02A2.6-like n=1 Tax=Rhipicephalus sanguineus TaxID=34632 RepID=UPI0020C29CDC|nr:uncharacterized protein K02A2.6-like [Rhipicephalus sanguineus]
MRPAPKYPWYRAGIDLFEYGGKSYLSVYGALYNFPEVEELRDTSAKTVIYNLGAIFSRYGIPYEVCTDNGPQFSSRDFSRFASKYDFRHVTSSPEFPRSNGLPEKGVQVAKRLLQKTKDAREDFWLGLLSYRSTPLEDGRSPGELLQGRRLRSTLPDFSDQKTTQMWKLVQKDHSKWDLPPLDKGQTVRIKKKYWSRKAKVVKQVYPRSYEVLTENNKRLRRNRQHLLPTSEAFIQGALESEPSTDEVQ